MTAALSKLDLTFRAGAALTSITPAGDPQSAGPGAVVAFPVPAGVQGDWSWWQATPPDGAPAGYAIRDPGSDAIFGSFLLADGTLQLTTNLAATRPPQPEPSATENIS